jgi:hypothetical protein
LRPYDEQSISAIVEKSDFPVQARLPLLIVYVTFIERISDRAN